jgi:hypothetical protein
MTREDPVGYNVPVKNLICPGFAVLGASLFCLLAGCTGGFRNGGSKDGLSSGPKIESSRYHYQLDLADPAWHRVRAGSLSPAADMALEHGRGEALLLIFAEPAGQAGLDQYLRESRAFARMATGLGAGWTSAETTFVRGSDAQFPGWVIEQHIDRAFPLLAYALVTVADGIGYHVLCWGGASDPDLPGACLSAVHAFRPIRRASLAGVLR